MEGEEEHIEDHQEDDSESVSLLFVASLRVGPGSQGVNNEHVAQSHCQQGQEEGQAGQQPLIPPDCAQVSRAGKGEA